MGEIMQVKAEFNCSMEKLDIEEPAHVDMFDSRHNQLLNNDQYLSDEVKKKVATVSGKGLSTNDYTSAEKTKLSGIATGANKYVHPDGPLISRVYHESVMFDDQGHACGYRTIYYPPENHASTTTTYGIGNSASFGHVRVSDSLIQTNTASQGFAASTYAVYQLNQAVQSRAPAIQIGTAAPTSLLPAGTLFVVVGG